MMALSEYEETQIDLGLAVERAQKRLTLAQMHRESALVFQRRQIALDEANEEYDRFEADPDAWFEARREKADKGSLVEGIVRAVGRAELQYAVIKAKERYDRYRRKRGWEGAALRRGANGDLRNAEEALAAFEEKMRSR